MKTNGFTLIEPLLGLVIFSLFLHVLWGMQNHTAKRLSDSLKISLMQSQLNQWSESFFAYPDVEINNNLEYEVIIEEHDFYRVIRLCSKTTKIPCLSTIVSNPNMDFQ